MKERLSSRPSRVTSLMFVIACSPPSAIILIFRRNWPGVEILEESSWRICHERWSVIFGEEERDFLRT